MAYIIITNSITKIEYCIIYIYIYYYILLACKTDSKNRLRAKEIGLLCDALVGNPYIKTFDLGTYPLYI